jgi:DNA-binding NtrC family response regulator
MASRGRILIVDDEANARAALSEILREEGYTTETAADGFKALGKLEEFAPDVVLTDLKMPGLDGIGLMEKAQAIRPRATFVVMTAFGTIANAVEAMKKGAYNYLTKPLDFTCSRWWSSAPSSGREAPPRERQASARSCASATRSAT